MALQSETKENQPPGLRKLLWGALILAVVLRVGAAIWLGDTLDGLQQVRVYDQHSYQALAESILAGKGYSFNRPWYPFASPAAIADENVHPVPWVFFV